MNDMHVPPAGGAGSNASPTAFAAPSGQGTRDGYSNLGQGPPKVADTALLGDGDDDDNDVKHKEEEEDEGEEADGGFVAATAGRRRNKMSYVGLDDGEADDTAADEDEAEEGGAAGAVAAAGGKDKASGRLAVFGLLNLAYVVLQLMGAMAFHSLALMSDGFHNLSDV